LEGFAYISKIERLHAQLQDRTRKIESSQSEIDGLREELAKAKKENDVGKSNGHNGIWNLKEENTLLSKRIEDLEHEKNSAQQELADRARNYESVLKRVKESFEEKSKKLEKLEADRDRLEAQNCSLINELDNARTEQDKIRDLKDEIRYNKSIAGHRYDTPDAVVSHQVMLDFTPQSTLATESLPASRDANAASILSGPGARDSPSTPCPTDNQFTLVVQAESTSKQHKSGDSLTPPQYAESCEDGQADVHRDKEVEDVESRL